MAAKGVDLEIVEKRGSSGDLNVTVPDCVRINGQEILLPDDCKIVISEISSKDVITVNLTMIVGSLTIRTEGATRHRAYSGEVVRTTTEAA